MRTTIPLLFAVASTAACSSPYRRVALGTGHATPGATGGPTAPAAVRIDHAGDLHEIAIQVSLPRAVLLDYELTCGGTTRRGVVGESWDHYRQRRLAELQRQRQRKTAAVSAIAGAVVGDVGARADVETPTGGGTVEAHADGAAVGGLVAEQIVPDVQLDPRDVGAQVSQRRVQLRPRAAGACLLRLTAPDRAADLTGVHGTFTVTRLANRARESWAAKRRADAQAIAVRGTLRASLVAGGADPTKRARERATARARIAAERQRRLVLQLRAKRLRLERQRRYAAQLRLQTNMAYHVRGRIVGWLGECGGDPHKRARERAAADRQRRAALIARMEAQRLRTARRRKQRRHRDALVSVALDLRGKLRGQLIDAGADPDYRWKLYQADASDEDAGGARPAIPASPVEVRPAPPSDAAIWVAGQFVWHGLRWVWQPGRWAARGHVRDHRAAVTTRPHVKPTPQPTPPVVVRDHRTAPRSSPRPPRVRDHRTTPIAAPHTPARAPAASPPRSRVRDHRKPAPTPKPRKDERVRDHR